MQNVILVVHILACLVMTGLVLVQKSEGGGLGIGGGGGGAGSLLSGRGAAGALVRSTIMFGGIFFLTSLALTTIANRTTDNRTEVERALGAGEGGAGTGDPADLLDPTVPLFDENDAAPADTGSTDAVSPVEGGLVDPTADLPVETDPSAAPEEAAEDSGNPQ